MFCFALTIRLCDVLLKLPLNWEVFGLLKAGSPVEEKPVHLADQAELDFVHSVLTENWAALN